MDSGRGEGSGTLVQITTVVTMSAVVDTQSRCANIEGRSEKFLSKHSCSKSRFTRKSMICVECKNVLVVQSFAGNRVRLLAFMLY